MSGLPRDPFALHDKTVLVTGASSGLGQATCRMIARQGGRVIATGRDAERLDGTLASLRDAVPGGAAPRHRAVVADLLDARSLAALVADCGSIDGLVLAAGIAQVAPLRYTTDKVARRVMAINVEARLALCQRLMAAKAFDSGGSIVFVSSLSVFQGVPGHSAYAASLAAVEGASRAIAAEVVGQGIRSNVVAPGLVQTPLLDGGSVPRAATDAMLARYPLGAGQPDDVAAAIVYLLAPASRWVTGQVLRMDGGYTLDV